MSIASEIAGKDFGIQKGNVPTAPDDIEVQKRLYINCAGDIVLEYE